MADDILKSIAEIREEPNGENILRILYMSAYFAPTKGMYQNMFLCVFKDIVEDLYAAVLLLKKKYLVLESRNQEIFFVLNRIRNTIESILKENGKEKEVFTEAVNLLTSHLLKAEIPLNYIHHALYLLANVRENIELAEISIKLPNLIVTALKRHSRLGEAYVFGKNALEFLEKAVGETHEEILALRHNMATILDAEGQHAEAVKVLEGFNEKYLKYSTVDDITKPLIQHARELCELSRYKDALPLYQILIGEKKVLDAFDKETLTTWHDYAILLSYMGRYSEAINILKEVLLQQSRVLVEDMEFGLLARQNLANIFREQGNYVRALEEIEEVFDESKKFYGELHPDTLRAERDIGILLLSKGDPKEALLKLEDVEKKFEQNAAVSHLDILRTRANITRALMELNEYNRALQISEDVYKGYKKLFGEKHHEVLQLKYDIGSIFLKQRKKSEAVKILRDVYEGFRDIFGPEHDKTVTLRVELENLGCFPTSLHEEVQKGNLSKIIRIIENGEDVNKADTEGRRPLHHAALIGNIRIAKYLLKMGAMYNAEDLRRATPYQLASNEQMKDLLNLVKSLFKDVKEGIQDNITSHRELINARDKNGYSLLHWAVCNSHKFVVEQLLYAGADPTCISLKGNTPLHIASSKGNKEIAEILLQSVTGNDLRCLVNYKTALGGNTALHVAAKNNNFHMVKCLLISGAGFDIENKDGLTPVHLSTDQSIGDLLTLTQELFSIVQEGNSAAITQLESINHEKLLIVSNTRNSEGHTLLQVAIENRHENIVHKLLELL